MKNIKFIFQTMLLVSIFVLTSCEEETYEFGAIIAPSNIQIDSEIKGATTSLPYGDGTGEVSYTANADNAISYKFIFNGSETIAPSGTHTYTFSNTGTHIYNVIVQVIGTGGVISSSAIQSEVLVLYEPPAELLETLYGTGTKTWRVKAEGNKHFGLGPVGGNAGPEWYGAGPNDKVDTGMYDDRYVFNSDGTFTHLVGADGTVFGRHTPMVADLGPTSEAPNGDDIENYPYADYSEKMSLSAPGGTETISLTGLAFIGYYTGGSHQYKIESRTSNEIVLRTTDAASQFDWWFTLVAE
ncbi:glucan endo-1,3-beta-D-glucosidase [Flavicella sediminum]|uniref:glucan endo-1,3-beta-D-glucosidase n=1 Tax=Flavicella sediminum TaxID=2585141 RepID=UPI001120811F|nr:glucan endo-1,3-beta-D-glucosidase [Flavicella sediminum]